jgi:hypothetical protein
MIHLNYLSKLDLLCGSFKTKLWQNFEYISSEDYYMILHENNWHEYAILSYIMK